MACRRIIVDLPDFKGRVAILGVHSRGKPLADDVDIEQIARRTPGFSGVYRTSIYGSPPHTHHTSSVLVLLHVSSYAYLCVRVLRAPLDSQALRLPTSSSCHYICVLAPGPQALRLPTL